MVKQYKKRPVVIEAIQWIGDYNEVKSFGVSRCALRKAKAQVVISTLEGNMVANIGDYIIKGVKGEFYPCKEDIFEQTYDEVLS